MEYSRGWEYDLFGSSNSNNSMDVPEAEDDRASSIFRSHHSEVGTGNSPSTSTVVVVPETPVELDDDDRTNEVLCPKPGTFYPDEISLFRAYQAHAKNKGFSITKRASRVLTQEGYKYSVWQCDRGRKSTAQKSSKRVDCKARVNGIRQEDGSWKEHDDQLEEQLEANDIAGIRVCKNVRLAEVQAGGPQNLGCIPKDCRNYVDTRRRLRLGDGDAEAMRKLFLRLHAKERDFFHIMDIGDDSRLRNVLWIHPRSKAAYEDFHDVVSFDTTYLVNRYKMPFATVVGVNQHGQSILLGCALVTHEDAESFKWLFSSWLAAMGGIHPTCIITDQCESIKIAIRDLMPNTIHRYCLWHILCKIPVKFKGIQNYHTAAKEFKALVYESLSIVSFEAGWADFVGKYGVESNEWLRSMYDERISWVPVFLNHKFWAGMTSTQRSEGMHAYFDGYINSRCTLKQFVEQYEIATVDKIHKEFLADFDSKYKVINCKTEFPWERQVRDAYTNNIFTKFQEQISRSMYCHTIEEIAGEDNSGDIGKNFEVIESVYSKGRYVKDLMFSVEYKANGQYLRCNCKSFESRGIICCHILKVMVKENLQQLNPRYMLHRWRKDVYRRHSGIFFAGGYPHMTAEYKKYQEVERCFQECTDEAMGSEPKMEFVRRRCIEIKNELMMWETSNTQRHNLHERFGFDADSNIEGTPIRNPDVARTCGRPRGTRIPSGHEGRHGPRGTRGRRGRGGRRRGRGGYVPSSQLPDLNENIRMSPGSQNF